MSFARAVDAKAVELGKHVLRMTTAAGSGHPSSALSILHVVITLMHRVMRYDPADPWHAGNDRLVLSEGHAVPAVYAAYAEVGGVLGKDRAAAVKLRFEDLAGLRELASPLDGHPNPAEGFPFFDAATGSLGQGLSVAAGLAAAARRRGIDKRIYCLIGDGESREGQIWEAADFIVDHKLHNVVAIFNSNGQGQADYVSPQQSPERLAAKLGAFGWSAEIINGHDADAIAKALSKADGSRPIAIVARTEKGWGCDLLKDKSNHGKPLTDAQLAAGIAALDATGAKLGGPSSDGALAAPPRPNAASALPSGTIAMTPFDAAMKAAGLSGAVEKNACATRRAYGAALLALARADARIVAFDGDVSNSTFADMLAKQMPERFFECKIAEQNMLSAAAGAAAAGLIPFASSFAKFLARAYDQIEMAQITRANVKIVGSHAGISLAADGPSQMSLHDVAYFRAAGAADNGRGQPVCVSLQPSDAVSAYACTWLMANHVGMCYMRTHRPDVPLLYSPDTTFRIGGSHKLLGGASDRLTIVSSGYMVHVCKEAAESLGRAGMPVTLIDAYCLPLDAEPILAAARRSGERMLVVEDNYVGGLAGALAEAAAEAGDVRVASMTCRRIPKSARTPAEIMAYVGLSPADIERKARELAK